ncbi:MAG: 2'-5' RNA ligase family protein [Planctomycetes bacterium]|nr:2'-5' RNA ligase family protein [Planctomycetota bacterium]
MKTYMTAVVAIPPQEIWEPIQAIRRQHDRKVDVWMPHVTLLYPFQPKETFEDAVKALGDLGVGPFEAALEMFRFFRHRPGTHTIWLDPQPAEPWKRLQAAVQRRFPECDDVSQHSGGFVPHLSVGQARVPSVIQDLQQGWRALRWPVKEIALIGREEGRPFEVGKAVPLA